MGGPDPWANQNPMKRQRMMPGMASMGLSPSMEHLVQQVKNFQKMSQESKELWNCYVDTYLGGNRDPARHDEATPRSCGTATLILTSAGTATPR